jgi:uncharacterized membrane protein
MDVISFVFGFVTAISVLFLVMFAVAASIYKKRNGG